MLVTALLTGVVIRFLFYGMLPDLSLWVLCVTAGIILAVFGHPSHEGVMSIDLLACRSGLSKVNAGLKVGGCLLLLFFCIAADSLSVGVALILAMMTLTVVVGGLSLFDYLSLLSLPVLFLLMSGLALLFSYEPAPIGVWNISFFKGWVCVTKEAQAQTVLVMIKALGAVSCLYLLSLSTPMTEIITVLQKARVPAIVIELMYLIYRYIFILLDLHHQMCDAAESRLGYDGYRLSLRTTGQIYGNLLALSFHKANACFDAMESRCYQGEIRFLERKKPIRLPHLCVLCGLILLVVGLRFFWGSV